MLWMLLAVVPLCGADSWMDRWLRSKDANKGSEYDFTAVQEFIKNSSGECASVFSPICSGMNVLLQGCAGEYGDDVKKQAVTDLKEIISATEDIDGEKLRALNRAYIPKGRTDLFPKTLGGIFRRYEMDDDRECGKLLEKHKKWVDRKSNGKVQSSLRIEDFTGGKRIYASLAYFKDRWYYQFDPERTAFEDFHLDEGRIVRREFMKMEEHLLHYEHVSCGSKRRFDLVAVPYACEDAEGECEFTRHAIYLVPKETEANLEGVWDEFVKLSGQNISALLCRCSQEKEVVLRIPKIKGLKSKLNLKETLRDMHGSWLSNYIESTMTAYINVDEQGTEAAAIVETDCVDGVGSPRVFVDADKPYILVVHDEVLDRILFAVKDMGTSGEKSDSGCSLAERRSSKSSAAERRLSELSMSTGPAASEEASEEAPEEPKVSSKGELVDSIIRDASKLQKVLGGKCAPSLKKRLIARFGMKSRGGSKIALVDSILRNASRLNGVLDAKDAPEEGLLPAEDF